MKLGRKWRGFGGAGEEVVRGAEFAVGFEEF
jgi:hypothetical protein